MRDLSNENVVHINKNGYQYLQFRRLLQYSDKVRHAYSLGIEKNFRTTGKYLDESHFQVEAAKNDYKLLCENIGTNYNNIIKGRQAHSDRVLHILEAPNLGPIWASDEISDGLITNKKDAILATTNADCILLLMYDPVNNVIANVHSGWRGTVQRIAVNAVTEMQRVYGSNPEDIICCMSPSIRRCHFEVDRDVKDIFEKEFASLNVNYIDEKIPNQKWNIDTVLINKIILQNAGLQGCNIIDSGICSVCDCDLIHSYRVEKEGFGLSTAIIELI